MKKNKFIVSGIASVLSLAAIATSFALYINKPADINISIGGSVTNDGNYLIGNRTVVGENKTIAPGRSVTYQYPIQFTKGQNSTYTQDTAIAHIEYQVYVDGRNDYDGLSVSSMVSGYPVGSVFRNNAGTANTPELNSKTHKIEGLLNAPVHVGTEGNFIEITFAYSGAADAFANHWLAEKQITLDIQVSFPTTEQYKMAYIVGSKTSWAEYDKYMMVPDVTASTYTWKYDNYVAEVGEEFKAKVCDTDKWSNGGGNYVVTEELAGTINIKWDGIDKSPVVVTASQQ